MRPRANHPPAAAAAADPSSSDRGRPRARGRMSVSDDVVSRCKSAPERSSFAAHPYYYSSEVPTSQPEKEITTSSRTRSRAAGQGTIDQYFIKKKEEMKVSQLRGTDSSLSANINVSQRSRRSRPDPPIGTTSSSGSITSSVCNTSTCTDEVPSTAEQREDVHANQRDSDLLLPSSLESDVSANLSSCPTAESDVSMSTIKIFEGGLPPSPTHLSSSPFNWVLNGGPALNEARCAPDGGGTVGSTVPSSPANTSTNISAFTMPVRLVKKGKYSTHLVSSMESRSQNSSRRSSSRRATERSDGRPRSGKSQIKTLILEEKNVSPLNSCQEIKESGEDFVSNKGKCPPEDHSSRIGLPAPLQRKSYSCRTVQIPPGKVGAVLYTSPLGPAVQSIKSTSSIYDQVEVGDLIVELDGVDVTERRAKEVTEMLINSADRERQIVVLKEKTLEDFEQDDEPSIGEDSTDRYLALDDDGDDEQALALASATVASGQTARAGNTRAHNKARNLAMNCSTRTAAKVGPANSETAKMNDSLDLIEANDCLYEAAHEPVREAPERSVDADGLLVSSRSVKSAGTRSSKSPRIPYVEAVSAKLTTKDNTGGISHRCCRSKHCILESNEAAKKYDSQKSKGSTAVSSTISDQSQRLPALGIILKTGSDVSSLSNSLESSWFGSDHINGSNARRLSPIHEGSATYKGLPSEALIAELEQRLALYKAASMERHHDTAQIVRDDRINSNASEHGFDLFLDGVGEGSSALSTLTPSLAGCGGDGRPEESADKPEKSFTFEEPNPSRIKTPCTNVIVGEDGSKSNLDRRWAQMAVLAGSSVISSGGNKQIARRAMDVVLSLWKESSTDNDQYADIDLQSIACAVADEILKVGGSQSNAAEAVGAIIRLDTKNGGTDGSLEHREDPMTKEQSKTLTTLPLMNAPSPPLLDLSTKSFADSQNPGFLRGVAALVSSLSTARDQIVQDIQQATESLPWIFSTPRVTTSEENMEESTYFSSTSVNNEDHDFNRSCNDSNRGNGLLFSTCQVGGHSLIVAETDFEIEIVFPLNEFGQVEAEATHGKYPARSFASSRDTCINFVAEKGPNRLLGWRNARRKQKARAKAHANRTNS